MNEDTINEDTINEDTINEDTINEDTINEDTIKILNLVLYSNNNDYDDMYNLTRKHYKKYKNVDTIYYVFSEKYNVPYYYDRNKDILYIYGKETYIPGILEKTVKSFKYVHNLERKFGKIYDYIVRSNISTIINFDKLSYELSNNPIDYGAGLVNFITKGYRHKESGIIDDRYEGLDYPSGTCIILSRKLFKRMVQNIDNIDYNVIDDVSIGDFIKRFFPEYSLNSYEKSFVFNGTVDNKICDPTKYIFFRNRHESRKKDIKMMKYIIDKL